MLFQSWSDLWRILLSRDVSLTEGAAALIMLVALQLVMTWPAWTATGSDAG